MRIGVAERLQQPALGRLSGNQDGSCSASLEQPGLSIEDETAHRRFQSGGVAGVTLCRQHRPDLTFKECSVGRLCGQWRPQETEKNQVTRHFSLPSGLYLYKFSIVRLSPPR